MKEYRVSLWGVENILEGHSGHTSTICKYMKSTDLYILRGEESYVNHISIKQLNQLKPLKPVPCPAGGLGRTRGRRLSVHVGSGLTRWKSALAASLTNRRHMQEGLSVSALAIESGNT